MEYDAEIGDEPSKRLADRLINAAKTVAEPRRSRISSTLPLTVFVSHTSRDDAIVGTKPGDGNIRGLLCEFFHDPFIHSVRSGGAEVYEKIVGLALIHARRVLVVWTPNAITSDYVRAEILIAISQQKDMAVFQPGPAPIFPHEGARTARTQEQLRRILKVWSPNGPIMPNAPITPN